ncbi:hypothetical protein BV22DRAFT_1026970, partial [Leucogyrophana mollusca]
GAATEACPACCTGCFVGCIESMVKCFNMYAYIEIALYGKPYISAVRDTWDMFRDPQMSLVFAPLTWGAYAAGLLCSFAYPYIFRSPRYAEEQYITPIVLPAFLIGLQCCMSTLRLMYSALLMLYLSNDADVRP